MAINPKSSLHVLLMVFTLAICIVDAEANCSPGCTCGDTTMSCNNMEQKWDMNCTNEALENEFLRCRSQGWKAYYRTAPIYCCHNITHLRMAQCRQPGTDCVSVTCCATSSKRPPVSPSSSSAQLTIQTALFTKTSVFYSSTSAPAMYSQTSIPTLKQTSTSTQMSTTNTSKQDMDKPKQGLLFSHDFRVGVGIGAAICIVAVVSILVGVISHLYCRKKEKKRYATKELDCEIYEDIDNQRTRCLPPLPNDYKQQQQTTTDNREYTLLQEEHIYARNNDYTGLKKYTSLEIVKVGDKDGDLEHGNITDDIVSSETHAEMKDSEHPYFILEHPTSDLREDGRVESMDLGASEVSACTACESRSVDNVGIDDPSESTHGDNNHSVSSDSDSVSDDKDNEQSYFVLEKPAAEPIEDTHEDPADLVAPGAPSVTQDGSKSSLLGSQ